jgi:hypothetical protein
MTLYPVVAALTNQGPLFEMTGQIVHGRPELANFAGRNRSRRYRGRSPFQFQTGRAIAHRVEAAVVLERELSRDYETMAAIHEFRFKRFYQDSVPPHFRKERAFLR